MATKKKSGNLVQLLRIAFDEVNKKFEGKNIEFKIQNSYNHDDVCMDSFNENQEYFWREVGREKRDPTVVWNESKNDTVSHKSFKNAQHNKPNLHALPEGFNFEKDYLPLEVGRLINIKDYDEELFDIPEVRQRYLNESKLHTGHGGYNLKQYFADIFKNRQLAFFVDKTFIGSVTIGTSYRGGKGERFELFFRDNKKYIRGSTVVPKTIRSIIQTHMNASERTEEMFFEQKMKELDTIYCNSDSYNKKNVRTYSIVRRDIEKLIRKYNFNSDSNNYDKFNTTLNSIVGMKEGDEYHHNLLNFAKEYRELLDEYNYISFYLGNTPKSRRHVKLVNYVNNKYSIVSCGLDGVYVRDYYDSPEDFPEEIRDKYSLLSNSDDDILYVGFITGDCYAITVDLEENNHE